MQIPHYHWHETRPRWDSRQGQNAGHTLVLTLPSDIPEHLMLLKKIMGAIGLDFDKDIHFMTVTDEHTIRLLSEPELNDYQYLLVFGISPEAMGLPARNANLPQIYVYENIQCIVASGLGTLSESPEQKKALWSVLKHAFMQS